MTQLTVTVAAYGSFPEAGADWDDFERTNAPASGGVVDAALIERTLDEVSKFHFQSLAGWGRGVIASAVYGVLWPPSILVGALAGSVAGHAITEVRRGLSREAISGLGAVIDHGSFLAIVVADRHSDEVGYGGVRAAQIASCSLDSTVQDLRSALDEDDAED